MSLTAATGKRRGFDANPSNACAKTASACAESPCSIHPTAAVAPAVCIEVRTTQCKSCAFQSHNAPAMVSSSHAATATSVAAATGGYLPFGHATFEVRYTFTHKPSCRKHTRGTETKEKQKKKGGGGGGTLNVRPSAFVHFSTGVGQHVHINVGQDDAGKHPTVGLILKFKLLPDCQSGLEWVPENPQHHTRMWTEKATRAPQVSVCGWDGKTQHNTLPPSQRNNDATGSIVTGNATPRAATLIHNTHCTAVMKKSVQRSKTSLRCQRT